MTYKKPELIDLSAQANHGQGQQMKCSVGSGALGNCGDGQTPGLDCDSGSGYGNSGP